MVSLIVNFWLSVIIVKLWRPKVARPGNFINNFCILLEKQPLMLKFLKNTVLKVFTASPIDIVVFKCRKTCQTENQWNRALFTWQKKTKFRLPLKLLLLRVSRPNRPGPAPNNVLMILQISSKSVHFQWSYSRMRDTVFCPADISMIFPKLCFDLGQ